MKRLYLYTSLFLLGTGAAAQPNASVFAANLAGLMRVPVAQVGPAVEAHFNCANQYPNTPIAKTLQLTADTAAFAVGEPIKSTQELLTDFTRQLLVQSTFNTNCTYLADLWQQADPFLRETADRGIGLAQSDIDAAEALDQLGSATWDSPAPTDAKTRLLAQWDAIPGEEEYLNLVFLTRLNAWSSGVTAAWDNLSLEGKKAATRVTFEGHVPDDTSLEAIIGTAEVGEWAGGSLFFYDTPDITPYNGVVEVAITGYFGGRSYVQLVAEYRATIAAMNSITFSMTQVQTVLDLVDMNNASFNSD